ncbi:MAG TPA: sulfotransferase domain-containing protein, partial [Methylovirgula sp.]
EPERIFGGLTNHLLLGANAEQVRDAIARVSFERLQEQEQAEGFKEKPARAERFFRAGQSGQWKERLTAAQIGRIVKDHGEQMERFGYLPK